MFYRTADRATLAWSRTFLVTEKIRQQSITPAEHPRGEIRSASGRPTAPSPLMKVIIDPLRQRRGDPLHLGQVLRRRPAHAPGRAEGV